MGFLDELAKAQQIRQRGQASLREQLDRIESARAVEQANEQVRMIKQSEESEKKQREQLRTVANQLTQELAFRNPASVTKMLQDTIGPPEPRLFQTPAQALLSEEATEQQQETARALMEDSREFQRSEREEAQEFELKKLGVKEQQLKKKEQRQEEADARARAIPGFGIANTKEAATETRKLLTELQPATKSLDDLIAMTNDPIVRITPARRAEAQALVGALRGQLRLALIGPGAVSDQERAILEDIIADPAAIFQLPSKTRKSLATIKKAVERKINTQLQLSGVTEPTQEQQRDILNMKVPTQTPGLSKPATQFQLNYKGSFKDFTKPKHSDSSYLIKRRRKF